MTQTNLRLRDAERKQLINLAQALGVSQTDAVRLLLSGAIAPQAVLGSVAASAEVSTQASDGGR